MKWLILIFPGLVLLVLSPWWRAELERRRFEAKSWKEQIAVLKADQK